MFRLISAASMTTALTVSSASPLSVRDLDGKTWTPLSPARAREHAQQYDLRCTILLDPEHRLVKAAKVTVTPEAAIFTQAGRTYRGRVDDLYVSISQARREATRHDVRDVLDAIVSGRTSPEAEAQAFGCFIERIKR